MRCVEMHVKRWMQKLSCSLLLACAAAAQEPRAAPHQQNVVPLELSPEGRTATIAHQLIDQELRFSRLERRATELENKLRNAGESGVTLMLFGAFCALWAQNTGRNPWLWFFAGLIFSVIAVVVLLTKNANDNFKRKLFHRAAVDK